MVIREERRRERTKLEKLSERERGIERWVVRVHREEEGENEQK